MQHGNLIITAPALNVYVFSFFVLATSRLSKPNSGGKHRPILALRATPLEDEVNRTSS